MSWKCYIHDEFMTDRRKVAMVNESADGRESYISSMEIKDIPDGEPLTPFIDLRRHQTDDMLQAIIDAAWEHGIKPRQLEDASNELKATKYHLEDMRKLAKVKT